MTDPHIDTEIMSLGKREEYRLPSFLAEVLDRSSNNYVVQENDTGQIFSVRYGVTKHETALGLTRSWVIRIEEIYAPFKGGTPHSEDILTITLYHAPADPHPEPHVYTIFVYGEPCARSFAIDFNAVTAMNILMNKIDAGVFPNVKKIMQKYCLQ